MSAEDGNFLSRWSRRKVEAKHGRVDEAPALAPPVPLLPDQPKPMPVAAENPPPAAEPRPTLEDVALLRRDSDFSRFVAPGTDEGVKHAAMKKLFSDPHYNVMDGLDTYIDDYGKPDPIPIAMLRRMTQSASLRLFEHEEKEEADKAQEARSKELEIAVKAQPLQTRLDEAAATPDTQLTPPHDDADLQLQQDHAAGRPGAHQGAGS